MEILIGLQTTAVYKVVKFKQHFTSKAKQFKLDFKRFSILLLIQRRL